jgi:hypothetical protein
LPTVRGGLFYGSGDLARTVQRRGASVAITDVEGADNVYRSVAGFSRGPERSFNSILFLNDGQPTDGDDAELGSFFSDLNLDQIVEAVTAGRDEYDLAPFFHLPLRNIDAIAYRHDIVRDLEEVTTTDRGCVKTPNLVLSPGVRGDRDEAFC